MNKAFLLVLLFGLVSGTPVILTLPQSNYTTCICDTLVTNFSIMNPTSNSVSCDFSLSGPWGTIAPQSAQISPQSETIAYIYITSSCFASPGNYDFSVNAICGGSLSSKHFSLRLTPCVYFQPAALTKNICYGSSDMFSLTIGSRSVGTSKNYDISVVGPNKDAISFSPKIFLQPHSTRQIEFLVNSSKLAVGSHIFNIIAAESGGGGTPLGDKAQATVNLNINNCQELSISTAGAKNFSTCIGEYSIVPLLITNNGYVKDTIHLSSSYSKIDFQPAELTLQPQQSQTVNAKIFSPNSATTIQINAVSSLGAKTPLTLSLYPKQCYGAELSFSAVNQTCSENTSIYQLLVTNLGKETNFKVSVSGMDIGTLSPKSFHLSKRQTKRVLFSLPPGVKKGEYNLTFTVSSPFSSSVKKVSLNISKCYDVKLTGVGGDICPCIDKAFPVNVINTGSKRDVFEVSAPVSPSWIVFNRTRITLKPGEKRTIAPYVFAYSCNIPPNNYSSICPRIPPAYHLIISAVSVTHKNVHDRLDLSLFSRSKKACFSIDLAKKEFNITAGVPSKLPLIFENNGLVFNAYVLNLSAPKWISLEKNTIAMDRGGRAEVILDVSPPRNISTFVFYVKVQSKDLEFSFPIHLNAIEKWNCSAQQKENKLIIRAPINAKITLVSPSGSSHSYTLSTTTFEVENPEAGTWHISVVKNGKEKKFNFSVHPVGTSLDVVYVLIILIILVAIIAVYLYLKKSGRI